MIEKNRVIKKIEWDKHTFGALEGLVVKEEKVPTLIFKEVDLFERIFNFYPPTVIVEDERMKKKYFYRSIIEDEFKRKWPFGQYAHIFDIGQGGAIVYEISSGVSGYGPLTTVDVSTLKQWNVDASLRIRQLETIVLKLEKEQFEIGKREKKTNHERVTAYETPVSSSYENFMLRIKLSMVDVRTGREIGSRTIGIKIPH